MDEYKLKLPLELNTVSSFTKQQAIVRPEGAAWHQFIWVMDGVGTFRMRDESFVLEKGQGIFMRAGAPCSYDGENLYTAWCAFFTTENLISYVIGDKEYLLFDVPDYLK